METIIKEAIKASGSQAKFARSIGVAQATVNRWLHGSRKVAPEFVKPLSRATGGKLLPHEIRPDLPDLFPRP